MNKRENIAGDTERLMRGIGDAARAASRTLALASSEQKNAALMAAAKALRTSAPAILAANAKDIAAAKAAFPDVTGEIDALVTNNKNTHPAYFLLNPFYLAMVQSPLL